MNFNVFTAQIDNSRLKPVYNNVVYHVITPRFTFTRHNTVWGSPFCEFISRLRK